MEKVRTSKESCGMVEFGWRKSDKKEKVNAKTEQKGGGVVL